MIKQFLFGKLLKRREQLPNVYSMVFLSRFPAGANLMYMCCFAAYSLEEAIFSAREHMKVDHALLRRCDDEGVDLFDMKLETFQVQTIDQLFPHQFIEVQDEQPPPSQPVIVPVRSGPLNVIMRKIIDNKDRALFEKCQDLFTNAEKKFIEDQLSAPPL